LGQSKLIKLGQKLFELICANQKQVGTNRCSLIGLTFLSFKVAMADERIGFVPTGSSGPFTFGSTTSFASLNDLSRSLGVSSSSFEDDNSKFPRSQNCVATAATTDHVFHSNRISTASASPQQYKKPLAWYDQVYPIPYSSSSSTVFKQEPLDEEWRYDEAEEESEDDSDNVEGDDGED
jgi:hypothetical protein